MKCLLITGASTGIGLQTALQFIKAGYHVVNLSRRPCPVAEVTHRCDGGIKRYGECLYSFP